MTGLQPGSLLTDKQKVTHDVLVSNHMTTKPIYLFQLKGLKPQDVRRKPGAI